MKKLLSTTLLSLAFVTGWSQMPNTPLVYDVEHTGSHYAAPPMPAADQLPVIRELPDALERVMQGLFYDVFRLIAGVYAKDFVDDLLGAPALMAVVDFLPVLPHPAGDYMQMVVVRVLMEIDDHGIGRIPHLLQPLVSKGHQLFL